MDCVYGIATVYGSARVALTHSRGSDRFYNHKVFVLDPHRFGVSFNQIYDFYLGFRSIRMSATVSNKRQFVAFFRRLGRQIKALRSNVIVNLYQSNIVDT